MVVHPGGHRQAREEHEPCSRVLVGSREVEAAVAHAAMFNCVCGWQVVAGGTMWAGPEWCTGGSLQPRSVHSGGIRLHQGRSRRPLMGASLARLAAHSPV